MGKLRTIAKSLAELINIDVEGDVTRKAAAWCAHLTERLRGELHIKLSPDATVLCFGGRILELFDHSIKIIKGNMVVQDNLVYLSPIR